MKNLYKDLFEIGISGSIQKLTARAYKLWGNPISVIDVQYNILCMLPHHTIEEGTWDQISATKKVSDSLIMDFIASRYLEESSKIDKAVLINWGVAKETPRMVCRIATNGAIQGFISVVLQDESAWTEEDSTYLEMFARAAGLVLQRSTNISYDTQALQPVFFSALLDKTISSQETLQRWMRSLSYSPKKYFWVAAFSPILSTSVFTLHFEYVFKQVKKQFSDCFSTCEKDCIYLLFNMDHLHDIEGRTTPAELAFYLENGFGVGLSHPFKNILQTLAFKEQADSALRLGFAKKEGSSQKIFRYEQFATDDLMSCICQNFLPESLGHPAIEILREYDLQNKTEYCLTLKYFVVSFLNHAYCVEKLRIHRNTLLYRLNKIESMANIDLSDPDTCFNLLMNFKVDELLYGNETGFPSS
ncbi:helix-turn-helix domain-containing protein [Oscillospiraceae bacterium MB08-C2-2]|nr:helix-turn-helix domain-containing protein [Oscillospiraceae bacterium MB08-C2-2]